MNYAELAANIIEKCGGKENIASVTHCVTRLRLVANDESRIDKDAIAEFDGVISCLFSSGQFQVVIGPQVDKVYAETIKITGNSQPAAAAPAKADHSIKGMAKGALDTLIACFTPCIPVIAGCGMIKVLVVLLTSMNLLPADSQTISVLSAIGDSVFYFLPVFVAFNAAKKMDTDPFLAMAMACVLLHPTYTGLGEAGTSVAFFGIPLMIGTYSAQALPAIFGTWILKYANRFAEKVSPSLVKIFLRPMLALLITVPVVLIVVGPVTMWLSELFLQLCLFMQTWGWLAVGVNALLFPIMVLTGTHNATIPLIIQMFATQGFDTTFLVSGMAANLGMAGAAFGYALRAKKKSQKSAAMSSSFSACLGITEPSLYGVLLPNKMAFVSMMAGACISGCLLGMAKITAPAFMTPSVITAALFFQHVTNVPFAIIAVVSCFAIPCILAATLCKAKTESDPNTILSPVKGEVIALEDVKDPVFSSKAMGEGFAVVPAAGMVKAPVSGTVSMLYPTKHAIGITADNGAEILIHIGMDTVKLNGQHFSAKVQQGAHVEAGAALIQFDLKAIKEAGYDPTTVVVVTNSAAYPDLKMKGYGRKDNQEAVLCLN